MYTLGGLDNPELGWGRADETWSFMETLGELGGETWFRLGDRDLARARIEDAGACERRAALGGHPRALPEARLSSTRSFR